MSAGARLAVAVLGSSVLAIAVGALVLGREALPTATYLVYTSEERALPADGLVTTEDGVQLQVSFKRVGADVAAAVDARQPAGVVLDVSTYDELPREIVSGWRQSGLVLAAFDVDAVQFALELEVLATVAPASGQANRFVLVAGADLADVTGNPATLNLDDSFVGAAYRPPSVIVDDSIEVGQLGWFQDDDAGLRVWLAERALESASAYGRSLD